MENGNNKHRSHSESSPYYVSVQSRTIMENQGDAAYELEIEAVPEEIESLQVLFAKADQLDRASAIRTPLPGISYHHDEVNDRFDECLQDIYRCIYDLGTEQTRKHIESMGILAEKLT